MGARRMRSHEPIMSWKNVCRRRGGGVQPVRHAAWATDGRRGPAAQQPRQLAAAEPSCILGTRLGQVPANAGRREVPGRTRSTCTHEGRVAPRRADADSCSSKRRRTAPSLRSPEAMLCVAALLAPLHGFRIQARIQRLRDSEGSLPKPSSPGLGFRPISRGQPAQTLLTRLLSMFIFISSCMGTDMTICKYNAGNAPHGKLHVTELRPPLNTSHVRTQGPELAQDGRPRVGGAAAGYNICTYVRCGCTPLRGSLPGRPFTVHPPAAAGGSPVGRSAPFPLPLAKAPQQRPCARPAGGRPTPATSLAHAQPPSAGTPRTVDSAWMALMGRCRLAMSMASSCGVKTSLSSLSSVTSGWKWTRRARARATVQRASAARASTWRGRRMDGWGAGGGGSIGCGVREERLHTRLLHACTAGMHGPSHAGATSCSLELRVHEGRCVALCTCMVRSTLRHKFVHLACRTPTMPLWRATGNLSRAQPPPPLPMYEYLYAPPSVRSAH